MPLFVPPPPPYIGLQKSPGNLTVQTARYLLWGKRLFLDTTSRLTLKGTTRMVIDG